MASFPDGIPWVLQAAGPVLTVDAGPLQARISQVTGHIQLAGPDLAGPDLAGAAGVNVIDLSPARRSSRRRARCCSAPWFRPRPTPAGSPSSRRSAAPRSRPTSRSLTTGCCAMRFVDWGSLHPLQTAIAGPSTRPGHFFRFGEKFDALDQAGHVVEDADLRRPRHQARPLLQGDAVVHQHPRIRLSPGFLGGEQLRHAGQERRGRFVVTNRFTDLALQPGIRARP